MLQVQPGVYIRERVVRLYTPGTVRRIYYGPWSLFLYSRYSQGYKLWSGEFISILQVQPARGIYYGAGSSSQYSRYSQGYILSSGEFVSILQVQPARGIYYGKSGDFVSILQLHPGVYIIPTRNFFAPLLI